jgi:chromosome segregation ATPase
MKAISFFVVVAALAGQALGQSVNPDTQVQRQILEELRDIHREIRLTSSVQLLLAELQILERTLERASQSRNDLEAQLAKSQADKAAAQRELERFEEGMGKVVNPDQSFVDRLIELKAQYQSVTAREALIREHLQDAEAKKRTAQTERDNVQAQLSDIIKKISSPN